MAIQWPWSSCPMMNREGEALRKVSGGSTVRKAKAIATPDEKRSVFWTAAVFCARNASGVDRESAPGILNFRSLGRMNADDYAAKAAVPTAASPAMGFPVKRWQAHIEGALPFAAHASCSGRPKAIALARFAHHRANGADRKKLILKQFVMRVFAAPPPCRTPTSVGAPERKNEMALDVVLKAP